MKIKVKYLLVIKTERNKKQELNFFFYVFVLSKFDKLTYQCDYKNANEESYKKTLDSIIKKYNPLILKC